MLEITNGVSKFTKGDSVAFAVELKNADGTEYTMQTGDKLKFTIKKSVYDNSSVTQAFSNEPKFMLKPIITGKFEPGRYCYDIELETANGEIYTIVGIRRESECNLVVYPEVTVANE